MEDMVRGMLTYKTKVDQLKSEKQKLATTYENSITKARSHISNLEHENMLLLTEIKTIESEVSQGQKDGKSVERVQELSYRIAQPLNKSEDSNKSKLLLERLKQLEAENSSLVLENEQQRQQYEKCLDEIANQVVTALLTQKGLREECFKLQTRVHDLEHQNRQLNAMFHQRLKFSSDSLLQSSAGAKGGKPRSASETRGTSSPQGSYHSLPVQSQMSYAAPKAYPAYLQSRISPTHMAPGGATFSQESIDSLHSICSDYMDSMTYESGGVPQMSSPPPWLRDKLNFSPKVPDNFEQHFIPTVSSSGSTSPVFAGLGGASGAPTGAMGGPSFGAHGSGQPLGTPRGSAPPSTGATPRVSTPDTMLLPQDDGENFTPNTSMEVASTGTPKTLNGSEFSFATSEPSESPDIRLTTSPPITSAMHSGVKTQSKMETEFPATQGSPKLIRVGLKRENLPGDIPGKADTIGAYLRQLTTVITDNSTAAKPNMVAQSNQPSRKTSPPLTALETQRLISQTKHESFGGKPRESPVSRLEQEGLKINTNTPMTPPSQPLQMADSLGEQYRELPSELEGSCGVKMVTFKKDDNAVSPGQELLKLNDSFNEKYMVSTGDGLPQIQSKSSDSSDDNSDEIRAKHLSMASTISLNDLLERGRLQDLDSSSDSGDSFTDIDIESQSQAKAASMDTISMQSSTNTTVTDGDIQMDDLMVTSTDSILSDTGTLTRQSNKTSRESSMDVDTSSSGSSPKHKRPSTLNVDAEVTDTTPDFAKGVHENPRRIEQRTYDKPIEHRAIIHEAPREYHGIASNTNQAYMDVSTLNNHFDRMPTYINHDLDGGSNAKPVPPPRPKNGDKPPPTPPRRDKKPIKPPPRPPKPSKAMVKERLSKSDQSPSSNIVNDNNRARDMNENVEKGTTDSKKKKVPTATLR